MNKIYHISVRDYHKIEFTKKPKAFAFFNILTWNFQNMYRIEFSTYLSIPIFDLDGQKILGAKFQIWPPNFLAYNSAIFCKVIFVSFWQFFSP